MNKVAIIGGGAAGIMAAISASKNGANVTLYEQNNRIGKKILATGNGRCNFTNADFSNLSYYFTDKASYKGKLLSRILNEFSYEDTIFFFEELGMTVVDCNGLYYPFSNQSNTVLDLLWIALEDFHVTIRTNESINDLKSLYKQYDAIILACGSNATTKINGHTNGYELAKSLGHTLISTEPSLVGLIGGATSFQKATSGVRTKVNLSLKINDNITEKESGELQLTSYGLSGIAIFQLSRNAAIGLKHGKKVEIFIDFLPYLTKNSLDEYITKRMERNKHQSLETFFIGMLHKKLILPLLKEIGYHPQTKINTLSKKQLIRCTTHLKEISISILGTNSIENAQVCSGGISVEELNESLMSSKKKGVFFAGEMIDIDGICGGYNLQWAWSSGYVAGRSAAQYKGQENDTN